MICVEILTIVIIGFLVALRYIRLCLLLSRVDNCHFCATVVELI